MTDTPLRTVLIVEDEPDVREILRNYISEFSFQVYEASNGEEALELLRRTEVHTVLSDISMPKMSGISLLEHVRSTFPDVPVVLITAYGDNDTIRQGLRLGAFDFIPKPFQKAEILGVVSRAVETGVRLRTLAETIENPGAGHDVVKRKEDITRQKKMIGLLSVKNNRLFGK